MYVMKSVVSEKHILHDRKIVHILSIDYGLHLQHHKKKKFVQ